MMKGSFTTLKPVLTNVAAKVEGSTLDLMVIEGNTNSVYLVLTYARHCSKPFMYHCIVLSSTT